MLQIKQKKSRYRNAGNKRKAAFCGSGFLGSKTLDKPMNLTINIIRRGEKNRTIFLKKLESSKGILRRRKNEYE